MKKWFVTVIGLTCLVLSVVVSVANSDMPPSPPKGLKIGDSLLPSPPPSTPHGNDGLLSGMTPENYSLASGWTLVKTQNFEGAKPSDENWGRWNGEVTSTKPHKGNKGIEGTYSAGQQDVGWSLSSETIGNFTEIYISFWEYMDSQALFNDEYMLAEFGVSGINQRIFIDWFWAQNSSGKMKINGDYAVLAFVNEQGPPDFTEYPAVKKVPVGAWVQWEIHLRPASADSKSDGFIRVYKDGNLYTYSENKSFNYRMGKSGYPTYVVAGGLYNRLVWMTDYPTCTQCSNPGVGTDACTSEKKWWYLPFDSPVCAPTTPSFKRFFDDIIVMKK